MSLRKQKTSSFPSGKWGKPKKSYGRKALAVCLAVTGVALIVSGLSDIKKRSGVK
jgi:hypothetical protein